MAAYRLYQDTWNEEGKTNDNSLAKMFLLKPEKLSPVLTYLMGQEDDRFPLSFLTEGMNATMEIEGHEYEYDVIGRMKKAVPLAQTVTTVNAGIGFSSFEMRFGERLFAKDYLLFTPGGYKLQVVKNPEPLDGLWVYTVRLMAKNASQFIPSTELVAGKLFAQAFAPVAPYGSTGNESFSMAPGKVRGQITTIRKSYRWEGNATQRSMTFEANIDGKTTKLWWDFEEYQHMLSFKMECEDNYWYNEDNRDAKGVINQKDTNGVPIPTGDGLLAQITNKDTYGVLTTQKIKQVVRDTLYGMSDASKKSITLFTGIGGADDFDHAMKDELANKSYIKLDAGKFVYGSDRNLSLGGFFTTYQHIDGHTVTVKKISLFDNGTQALVSDRHPVTGLPMESHRMVFVDTSTYNGQSNLVMVNKKGRAMIRRVVAGINELPADFKGNDFRASDKDASSVHFLKASQVVLRRFNTSIDLRCTLS